MTISRPAARIFATSTWTLVTSGTWLTEHQMRAHFTICPKRPVPSDGVAEQKKVAKKSKAKRGHPPGLANWKGLNPSVVRIFPWLPLTIRLGLRERSAQTGDADEGDYT